MTIAGRRRTTFVLFALLAHDDYMHVRARGNFEHFMEYETLLLTSSYVIIETPTPGEI